MNKSEILKKCGRLSYFLGLAIVVALFVFHSSPFYAAHHWDDPNCFFTVGRAVLDGKVMYRDIYEQKGPWLYFLHAFCAWISNDSFLGVFFLEIINLFFIFLLVSKIVGLYGYKPLTCTIVATLVGLSFAFSYAMWYGDSVEEFCSTLYLYLLYVTIKNIKKSAKYSVIEFILIGVMIGFCFWSKFTLVAIYVGWFAYFIWRSFRRKEGAQICWAILYMLCGFFIITLPCILYFVINGALKDLMVVYFYNNLFVYSQTNGIFYRVGMFFLNILKTLAYNLQYSLAVLFGVIWFGLKKEGEEKFFLLWILPITAFVIYVGGRGYPYYGLPLSMFSVFGYVGILEVLEPLKKEQWKKIVGVSSMALMISCCVVSFFVNGNHHFIFRDKMKSPQHYMAQYMKENGDENSTLLTWGMLDAGFYLAAGQVPEYKFFCKLNIDLAEMHEEIERYLDEKLPDYVVVKEQKNTEKFSHENYHEVLRMQEWCRGKYVWYVLYEVNE